jgi:hypothetical protein
MKNIYLYYIAIFAPLLVLVGLIQSNFLPLSISIFLLLIYVFLYRTYIDGLRLVSKKIIGESEIWKLSTYGVRSKYFKELYLIK